MRFCSAKRRSIFGRSKLRYPIFSRGVGPVVCEHFSTSRSHTTLFQRTVVRSALPKSRIASSASEWSIPDVRQRGVEPWCRLRNRAFVRDELGSALSLGLLWNTSDEGSLQPPPAGC